MTPLSSRVVEWFQTLRFRRTRDPLPPEHVRSWLRKRSRPAWDAAVDVELCFGGVIGKADDGSVIAFGVHDWFGRVVVVDGRECVLVGYCDPVSVFVDEDGRVVEVDDHGHGVVVADSLAHRLEQRALEEWVASRCVSVVDGRHGDAWAAILGLDVVVEACDGRQQWWATPNSSATSTTALLLRQQCLDDGWQTWLSSGTREGLERALGAIKS